jgi:superfamily II DNA or RNA helicase
MVEVLASAAGCTAAEGGDVCCGDERLTNIPDGREVQAPTLHLRPYQADLVARLRASFALGRRAPLLQLATGAGKTPIFGEITKGAAAKGRKVLVIAHRRELVRQASDKLTWAGVPHGIIAAGLDLDHDRQVVVASIQTAVRRLDRLPKFDLLVIDEAHHSRADTWANLFAHQRDARLLGVTATPARLDGKGLGVAAGGYFDDLVIGPSTKDLIDAGWLSPARCFVPERILDFSKVRTVGGDWDPDALVNIVDTSIITGDAVLHYRRRADHQPAIAFCIRVDHAEHVAAAFRGAGYRSACVHGGTPKDRRDDLILGLGTGAVEVLTSCDLISEGLDVPSVGCVILLRPTQSLVLHRQQIGRGMRPGDGKTLTVNDHVGNIVRHGPPEVEPRWTLNGIERRPPPDRGDEDDAGERNGRGRPVPTTNAAGELIELTAERRLAAMPYRRIVRGFMRGEVSKDELRSYARARGYKPGWIWHLQQERAGQRPRELSR